MKSHKVAYHESQMKIKFPTVNMKKETGLVNQFSGFVRLKKKKIIQVELNAMGSKTEGILNA